MSRATIPIIAALLVALAIAGVVMGVATQLEPDTAAAKHQTPDPAADGDADSEADDDARDNATPPVADPPNGRSDRPEAAPDPFMRFGVERAPARHAGAIRLATYNVENLFDDIDDPALTGRNEDIDDTKPAAHLAGLAAAIRELDADILALEEIESEAVARWFRDTHLSDLGYDHLASIDAGDERGIEQAVLSRFPITSATNWPGRELGGAHPERWGDAENWNAGEPVRFHRSPLRVEIEITGPAEDPYALVLYVVHAKSGRPGGYWREAEARELAAIIAEEAAARPNQNTAILGDFNALLTDASVQTLLAAGFTDAHRDVYEPTPAHATHASERRIDLILVNANLASELVPRSGFVLGTPSLPEGVDYRDPWRPDGYASDHFPVAIEIVPVEFGG